VIIFEAAGFFDDRNSGALGKPSNRRRKVHVLIIHDESENGATRAATETMIGLTLWIDMKGRCFLAMEWAKRPPACPSALERKVGANHFNNVIGFGDALDGFLGDAGHNSQITLRPNLARGRFSL
jgi:hypothetical protein